MIIGLTATGCGSLGRRLKDMMGGRSKSATQYSDDGPSYYRNPNLYPSAQRQYKRVNKKNFSDEQALGEESGSLWRRAGQGSYLFTQNNLRMMGDILNIEMEGKAAENLQMKVKYIRSALAKVEPVAATQGANGQPAPGAAAQPADGKAQAATDTAAAQKTEVAANPQAPAQAGAKPDLADGKFDQVPCRIVERNKDGSYKVKGQQTVYVGFREYKLIVTGVVRPDDIARDVVGASKLIDAKYDLVAANRSAQ